MEDHNPPITYAVDADCARRDLDYSEMTALSGMFRRWAIYEAEMTPEERTEFIKYSADYERLAEWVGMDWRAPNPSAPSLMKFIATLEMSASNVLDFRKIKGIVGRE